MAREKGIGKFKHKNGYIVVRSKDNLGCPFAWEDGRIYEHVLRIWEAGIYYDPEIHVIHHLNGKRDDNRLENLAVVLRAEHENYIFSSVKIS